MSIWVKNSKILLTPQWGREPKFTPPHSFTPLKKTIKPWNGSVDKCWGELKQKHKKQPFGDASASHLSLVLRYV